MPNASVQTPVPGLAHWKIRVPSPPPPQCQRKAAWNLPHLHHLLLLPLRPLPPQWALQYLHLVEQAAFGLLLNCFWGCGGQGYSLRYLKKKT